MVSWPGHSHARAPASPATIATRRKVAMNATNAMAATPPFPASTKNSPTTCQQWRARPTLEAHSPLYKAIRDPSPAPSNDSRHPTDMLSDVRSSRTISTLHTPSAPRPPMSGKGARDCDRSQKTSMKMQTTDAPDHRGEYPDAAEEHPPGLNYSEYPRLDRLRVLQQRKRASLLVMPSYATIYEFLTRAITRIYPSYMRVCV